MVNDWRFANFFGLDPNYQSFLGTISFFSSMFIGECFQGTRKVHPRFFSERTYRFIIAQALGGKGIRGFWGVGPLHKCACTYGWVRKREGIWLGGSSGFEPYTGAYGVYTHFSFVLGFFTIDFHARVRGDMGRLIRPAM